MGEVLLQEGELHNGLFHVIKFVGQKRVSVKKNVLLIETNAD
ncbi:hypothetical protein [Niallia sp. Marseille-Q9988]